VSDIPSSNPPFVEDHDLAHADHPVFVWDGDAAAFAWANRAGLDCWGALSLQSFRASGLDRAMPAMLRLAELSATALPAEGIHQTLMFWTPHGVCRLSCRCRPVDLGDGGHGLILEADPVAGRGDEDEFYSTAGAPRRTAQVLNGAGAHGNTSLSTRRNGALRRAAPGQRVSGFLNGAVVAEQEVNLPAPSDDDHHAMQEIARMLGRPAPRPATKAGSREIQPGTRALKGEQSGFEAGRRLREQAWRTDASRQQERSTPLAESSSSQGIAAGEDTSSEAFDNLNHELRTPLNSIIGFAEMMHTEQLGPIGTARYKEYAGDILDSARHALSLINDLLDASRVRAGHLNITFEEIDVPLLLERAIALMEPQARAASVRVVAGFPDDVPPIQADARAMRQILLNILTNAIKFTPPGGRVFVTAQRDDDGETVIAVRDTGVGMTDEQIGEAMKPWARLDNPGGMPGTGGPPAGSGLGLPLVKTLIEAQNGALRITSAPGEGTRVEIVLPAAPGAGPGAG